MTNSIKTFKNVTHQKKKEKYRDRNLGEWNTSGVILDMVKPSLGGHKGLQVVPTVHSLSSRLCSLCQQALTWKLPVTAPFPHTRAQERLRASGKGMSNPFPKAEVLSQAEWRVAAVSPSWVGAQDPFSPKLISFLPEQKGCWCHLVRHILKWLLLRFPHNILLWKFPKILTAEGFPGRSDGKESACNEEDPGLIPGSGR